jgi:hypothetical protein
MEGRMEINTCKCPPGIMYNIYVADIPRRPETEISQFSDDTTTCTSNKNTNNAY